MAHGQQNEHLRNARTAAGLTQLQLAAQTGVSQSVISSMEGGHLPGALASAILIARALGQDVETLFGRLVASAQPTTPNEPPNEPPPRPRKTTSPRAEARARSPKPAPAKSQRPPRTKAVKNDSTDKAAA